MQLKTSRRLFAWKYSCLMTICSVYCASTSAVNYANSYPYMPYECEQSWCLVGRTTSINVGDCTFDRVDKHSQLKHVSDWTRVDGSTRVQTIAEQYYHVSGEHFHLCSPHLLQLLSSPVTRLEQVAGAPKTRPGQCKSEPNPAAIRRSKHSDLVLLSQICYHVGWKCDTCMPYCLRTAAETHMHACLHIEMY